MSKKELNIETIEARNVSLEVIKRITSEELCYIAEKNPCLRGMIDGYIYELHLEKLLLSTPGVTDVFKPDDHDRKRNKSDFIVKYKGKDIRFQSKSIQTNSIKWDDGVFTAIVQNDSSDKHDTILPNGNTVRITNYKYGDYDILAVCLVNFTKNMDFAFKLNSECSCTNNKNISQENRRYIMNTTEKITYPLDSTWSNNISEIMDKVKDNIQNYIK